MKKLLLLLGLLLPIQAHAACVCTEELPTHLEIVSAYPAPLEYESEWVELVNTGDAEIDLLYFTLEDSTGEAMTLSGTLSPGESVQIDELKFNLNNDGDHIKLKTVSGELIDELEYSNSNKGTPIPEETSSEEAPETTPAPSKWPELSEALPNPEGTDTTEEWIELYNPYSESLNLSGLQLDDQDGGSSAHVLEGTMEPHSHTLIPITDSGITLNNSTDEIRLLDHEGKVLWTHSYDDPPEGESYTLVNDAWTWTDQLTPAAPNLPHSSTNPAQNNGDLSDDIKITEIYPNPEGSDSEDEWIEITNGGSESVNLSNWTIDDGEGGSDPYTFPEDTSIESGETFVIYRKDSGVALNNSADSARLIDFTGEIVDEVEYEQSVEGQSYAEIQIENSNNLQASLHSLGKRIHASWEWVQPSPGNPNPLWKSYTGTVLSFQENTLELDNGIEVLNFQSLENKLGELIFKPGNTVMIQASIKDGIANIVSGELISQSIPEQEKSRPWGLYGSLFLGLIYCSYEWQKSHKNAVAF